MGSDISNSLQQSAKGLIIPQGYTQAAQEIESIYGMPQKQVNGLWDNMIQDIPIARNSLNDKINALGDPITRDVDVFTSEETKDPVWQYLLRKHGWVAPVNKRTMVVFDGKQDRPITDDEYYNFTKLRGQKIKESINSLVENGVVLDEGTDNEDYKTAEELTPFQLKKALTVISTKATKEAKMELFNPDEEPKPSSSVRIDE